jgi:hypothetical protein
VSLLRWFGIAVRNGHFNLGCRRYDCVPLSSSRTAPLLAPFASACHAQHYEQCSGAISHASLVASAVAKEDNSHAEMKPGGKAAMPRAPPQLKAAFVAVDASTS